MLFAVVCSIQAWRYLFKTKTRALIYGQAENMGDIAIIMAGLFYMMILVAIAVQSIVTGRSHASLVKFSAKKGEAAMKGIIVTISNQQNNAIQWTWQDQQYLPASPIT